MVNDHHRRNRQPCTPDTEDLAEIRRQQCHSKTPAPDIAQASSTTQVTVAAGVLTGSAQKFQSYPNKFREVIERAKLIAQCECATKSPFPDCATFLDTTGVECFNKAISECEDVPPGQPKNYSD